MSRYRVLPPLKLKRRSVWVSIFPTGESFHEQCVLSVCSWIRKNSDRRRLHCRNRIARLASREPTPQFRFKLRGDHQTILDRMSSSESHDSRYSGGRDRATATGPTTGPLLKPSFSAPAASFNCRQHPVEDKRSDRAGANGIHGSPNQNRKTVISSGSVLPGRNG